MATQITLTQIRTVVDTDPPNDDYVFRLDSSVLCDSSDSSFVVAPPAPACVFLFQKGEAEPDDVYVHVCTLGDYVTYKDTREGESEDDFYRKSAAIQDFDNLDNAVSESDMQKTRLQNLVTDWENYADNSWDAPDPGEDTVITGD